MPALATQSGYCLIRFDIDAQGSTFNVEAGKCSDDMFAESAANAVRQWVYNPKLENGVAVVRPGVETQVTFKLSAEEGEIIEEPEPVDKYINDALSDDQKAKLAFGIPKEMQQFSIFPTPYFCCVRYDVSQIGEVFNEDIVTCSDFKFHDSTKYLIRRLRFKPANYNGKKISSGGYTMLMKYIDTSQFNNDTPMQIIPVIGEVADKNKLCQFD